MCTLCCVLPAVRDPIGKPMLCNLSTVNNPSPLSLHIDARPCHRTSRARTRAYCARGLCMPPDTPPGHGVRSRCGRGAPWRPAATGPCLATMATGRGTNHPLPRHRGHGRSTARHAYHAPRGRAREGQPVRAISPRRVRKPRALFVPAQWARDGWTLPERRRPPRL